MNVLSADKNFLGLDHSCGSWEFARAVILPVAMELSTSYGSGTRNGPGAILRASRQVELFDEVAAVEPCRMGIATVPSIALESQDAQEWFTAIRWQVSCICEAGKLPVLLGGEHTLTCGSLSGFPDGEIAVVSFDAHADCRDTYEGNRFSHACVMRRVHESGIPVHLFGIRSLCMEERAYLEEQNIPVWYAHDIRRSTGFDRFIESLPENLYISFDCDFFDPSLLQATGTPEPGGWMWHETLDLLQRIISAKSVMGIDVVELAPIPGFHHADFTVAKLVYKMIGWYFQTRA